MDLRISALPRIVSSVACFLSQLLLFFSCFSFGISGVSSILSRSLIVWGLEWVLSIETSSTLECFNRELTNPPRSAKAKASVPVQIKNERTWKKRTVYAIWSQYIYIYIYIYISMRQFLIIKIGSVILERGNFQSLTSVLWFLFKVERPVFFHWLFNYCLKGLLETAETVQICIHLWLHLFLIYFFTDWFVLGSSLQEQTILYTLFFKSYV